jgi:hypothetical protein
MTPEPRKPNTIETLSRVILASPAPVILLDTCSVLDIIRAGGRERCPPGLIPAALEMIDTASKSAPGLWIVVAELVQSEWNDNCERVELETRKRINELDQNIKALTEVLRCLVSVLPEGVPNFSRYAVESLLKRLAVNLLRAAKVLQEDDACSKLANRRAMKGWAPASKGKNSLKDCMIIEHYISLCRQLGEAGFGSKCVFVSSNVNDYGKGGRPLSPLDENFRAVGIEYATDLAWASSIVRAC